MHSAASARYYLLGLSYFENMIFAEQLLRKIRPRATVYVINVDDFFERTESPPVKTILHDPAARTRYETKRLWQRVQERVCKLAPVFCRHEHTIFRSRVTGAYSRSGHFSIEDNTPVSYDQGEDEGAVKSNTAGDRSTS